MIQKQPSNTYTARPNVYTPTPEDQIVQWYAEGVPFGSITDRINEQISGIPPTTNRKPPIYNIQISNDDSTNTTQLYTLEDIINIVQTAREHQVNRVNASRDVLIAEELTKIDRLEQEYWIGWKRSVEWQTRTDTDRTTFPVTAETDTPTADTDTPAADTHSQYEPDTSTVNTNVQYEPPPEVEETQDTPETDWSNWARIERTQQNPYNSSQYNSNSNRRHRNRPRFHPVYPIAMDTDASTSTSGNDKNDTPKTTITRKITTTPGDKKFLDGIKDCISMRIQLLGLNAPTKSINVSMSEDTMRAKVREMALRDGIDPDLIVDSVVTEVKAMKALPEIVE